MIDFIELVIKIRAILTLIISKLNYNYLVLIKSNSILLTSGKLIMSNEMSFDVKTQKDRVVELLKERSKAAYDADNPPKTYILRYYQGTTYFGANLRKAFTGRSIEEAILKMDEYLMKNTLTRKNERISLIALKIELVYEVDPDDVEGFTDAVIELLDSDETLWIEEYEPYDII
jgi:hypothetical protein